MNKLTMALSAAFMTAMTTGAFAEVHEVRMVNKSDSGMMVFEPAYLQIENGDTVKFLATDKGHNAETIDGMLPEGAEPFAGKINEEIEVVFDVDGLYGVKCKPHFTMGMVMSIKVGDAMEVPQSYFEGRVPKKALERLEAQIEELATPAES